MKTKKIKVQQLFYALSTLLCLIILVACNTKQDSNSEEITIVDDGFNGKIALDIRDSESDWSAYTPKSAPEGAPNVLFILYDDTGLGAWSPYGGAINMPTMDKLAANGLTYTQWHTTALCSPTRSTIQTGRNHHLNGMAAITEAADGFPGSNGRMGAEVTPLSKILQDNGYSTFWIGKNHNVPEQDVASGGSKKQWPLQMGWDRFYGFIGGETNQWYPDLIEDNHFVEREFEEDYHLSKDLADHALAMLRDQQATNPSKPWYMWYNPGANHAPHHAPEEYIEKYKGKFDAGYDAYREWVTERMTEKGILPEGTVNTPMNPMREDMAQAIDMVRPWDSLNDDEKKLFAKMAEVYAGFSEYTDAQVGRVIDYLEESGQLENTIIMYAADNGASGEGSPNGSVNENKFFNGYPDELSENMKYLDVLGGPETYEHYPTGWASAFSAPFKMFKRYSQYAGGTNDPLVISWPKGIKAKGEIRHQYHHSVDIVPTLLEVIGLEMPEVYNGVKQVPISGVSMAYTFDADPNAPTEKEVQYFAMLGSRGIWKDGWKAAAIHAPLSGKGNFDKDDWELYHVAVDRSESNDLAEENPEKLQELIDAWFVEAEKNNVLPLDDRSAAEVLTIERPSQEPKRDRYIYYPGAAPVPEGNAVNIRGRSYKILANVETTKNTSGILFAHGSRFGGHTLFIKNNKLYYSYNFLGINPEQVFESDINLTPGKHTLGIEFTRESTGKNGESVGTTKLYIDEQVVAEGPMRTQPAKFTLSGDGLCVGYDSADAVSELYPSPSKFSGGKLDFVGVTVEGTPYIDLEAEAKRVMMSQ